MQLTISKSRFWLAIMLPFAFGFAISCSLRAIGAIIVDPVMGSLKISAAEFGFVMSTFMLAIALGQVPLGILLDSWGARRTQALFFTVASVGMLLFGLAPNVFLLGLGRGLVGLGMAGSLIGAFKAISEWVSKEKLATYNGVLLGAGGLGILAATTPSKLFELHFGWRALSILLAVLTFLTAVVIFFVSADKSNTQQDKLPFKKLVHGLRKVVTDRFFWQITPLFASAIGGFIAMQALWLGPWLEHVVGFSPIKSANYLLVIAIGTTVGMLSGGFFSYLAKLFKVSLRVVVLVGIGIHIATQLLLVFNIWAHSPIIWFVYAYFAQVGIVSFAIMSQYFGSALSGRSNTSATIALYLFSFAVQYLFGVIVEAWPKGSGMTYQIVAYQVAFGGLVVVECLALLWYFISPRLIKSVRVRSD